MTAGFAREQRVSAAGRVEMAGEHEVGKGGRRGQSPLSRNLAGEGNKARGKELEGEVGKRECFCLFVFRR